MLNNPVPHNNNSNTAAEAVVLYKTPSKSRGAQRFIATSLLVVSIVTISLQSSFVFNANAQDAPVTSPVTGGESPAPSTPATSPEAPAASNKPSNGGGNSGNNNSSNGGSSVGAPSCNTEAPKSAPVIVSAVSTGKNQITLTWTAASGNVTEYVVAYGLSKGKPLYGAQFGNVTTTTIKGLAGGVTYFFKVRAGNGCMPGAYSQDLAVKVGGKFINSPAEGFKPGVLGTNKNIKPVVSTVSAAAPKPSASGFVSIKVEQSQAVNPNSGLMGKIVNFFSGFFN